MDPRKILDPSEIIPEASEMNKPFRIIEDPRKGKRLV